MAFRRLHNRNADYSGIKRIRLLTGLSTLAFFGLIALIVVIIGVVIFIITQVPSPDTLTKRNIAKATKIYDSKGDLLYDIYADENRTPIKIEEVPDSLKKATISIEDKDFYTHKGFSVVGYLRAAFSFAVHRQVEGGGSTLTQQLVKNALLTSDVSLIRKFKELVLSIEVESTYSKDKILEMYLNEIPYGGTAYGIEAAANLYFGKHAHELDLAEASFLAGLPQRPSVYSPYGTHPELGKQRQQEVLRRMVEDHYITQDQATQAQGESLTFRTSKNEAGFKAPHFVLYVKQKLIDEFGDKLVEQGGLKVTTTLDYSLQEQVQNIVSSEISKLKDYKVGNGAAVVINPKNGQILAMVGSKDYFAPAEPEGCTEGKDCVFEGNVNVALRPRQPGSATKPITYSVGLQKGYTAATPIMDVKTDFPGGASEPVYSPVNYDGTYKGPVQVRYALGNSLNIPAVKMLALVGVKNVMEQAYKMGVSDWEPTEQNVNNVGLSLTLGGRELKLLDLTSAFGVFADGGKRQDPISVLKVEDSEGKTLYEYHETEGVKVLDEGIAFIVSNMLSDNGARSAVFGSNSILNIPGHTVSVKTGTTDQKRDNWAFGFTPSIVTGVWVGNNDNTVMNPAIASGVTGASPIWRKIMDVALKNKGDEKPKQPDNVVQADVDGLMGGQPKDGSPTRKEFFLKGSEPKEVSPAYQHLKTCKINPHQQANDGEDLEERDVILLQENDPTGANKWQDGINKWVLTALDARFVGTAKGCNGIPGFSGGGTTGGVISIANIPNGANVPRVFDVLAQQHSPNGVRKVTWMVDGSKKKEQTGEPFALHVEFPNGDHNSHTISVTLEDNNGQSFTSTIGVTVTL